LRRKIEPIGASPALHIINDGSGYRLILQAEHQPPLAAPSALRPRRRPNAQPVAA
jgi:hypothetical protein